MNTSTPHRYIDILRFAFEHRSFTKNAIMEKLDLTDDEFQRYVVGNVASHDPDCSLDVKDPKRTWRMNPESFLSYLDYLELEQAREASKSAKNTAIWAISISAVLALFSIVLALYQVSTTPSVRLDRPQATAIDQMRSVILKMDGRLVDINSTVLNQTNSDSSTRAVIHELRDILDLIRLDLRKTESGKRIETGQATQTSGKSTAP